MLTGVGGSARFAATLVLRNLHGTISWQRHIIIIILILIILRMQTDPITKNDML